MTMKCVCTRTCQVKIGKAIIFVAKDEVMDFEECPAHFQVLDADVPVDFENDSEQVLMEKKWKFKEAAKAVKELFGVELKKKEGDNKSDVIERIVDARYRSLDGFVPNKVV